MTPIYETPGIRCDTAEYHDGQDQQPRAVKWWEVIMVTMEMRHFKIMVK